MSQIETKDITNQILNKYKLITANMNGSQAPFIADLRSDAASYFENIGLPTPRMEDWKYTNVAFLKRIEFEFPFDFSETITDEEVANHTYKGFDFDLVVIENGKFSKKHSKISNQSGVEIKSFADAINENQSDIEEHLSKVVSHKNNPFTAINTALIEDGVFIKIAKNANIEKPIHILNLNKSNNSALWVNSRQLIIAGQSANAIVFDTTHNIGSGEVLSNVVGEVFVGANAKIDYYKIQDDNEKSYYFGNTATKQEQDSIFAKTTISLDGKFVRNNLYTVHNGRNCETHYYGVFCLNKRNFVDNHTFMDHAMPDCYSDENYKGILEDNSVGVFNGKILVRRDAQRTNAYQSNKNVLLSDSATINTKPELEIYADDVKCSHGATSGALEKDYIFYLQSRGIDKAKAEAILLNAFAQEIVEKIKIPVLKEIVANQIVKRLKLD